MTAATITTPSELLALADDVLRDHATAWGGSWARAVALLTRQALEAALEELWRSRRVDLSGVSARAQLVCLGPYLDDDTLAAEVRYAWGALSRACHHHPYELAPTAEELARWLATVRALLQRIRTAEATG